MLLPACDAAADVTVLYPLLALLLLLLSAKEERGEGNGPAE